MISCIAVQRIVLIFIVFSGSQFLHQVVTGRNPFTLENIIGYSQYGIIPAYFLFGAIGHRDGIGNYIQCIVPSGSFQGFCKNIILIVLEKFLIDTFDHRAHDIVQYINKTIGSMYSQFLHMSFSIHIHGVESSFGGIVCIKGYFQYIIGQRLVFQLSAFGEFFQCDRVIYQMVLYQLSYIDFSQFFY